MQPYYKPWLKGEREHLTAVICSEKPYCPGDCRFCRDGIKSEALSAAEAKRARKAAKRK